YRERPLRHRVLRRASRRGGEEGGVGDGRGCADARLSRNGAPDFCQGPGGVLPNDKGTGPYPVERAQRRPPGRRLAVDGVRAPLLARPIGFLRAGRVIRPAGRPTKPTTVT